MINKYDIFLYAAMYAVFNVAGAAIIKHKLQSVKIFGFQEFIVFLVDTRIILALIFVFISMFFSIKALSIASFSSVIPLMTAINFIITVTVGALVFKDHLMWTAYAGIFLIVVGVIFLGNGYEN